MIFRCKRCQSAVWVGAHAPATGEVLVKCRGCGQPYDLGTPREARAVSRNLARRARILAGERGLDLPGAYSVLLGLMTEEQAKVQPLYDLSRATPGIHNGKALAPASTEGEPSWQDARRAKIGEGADPLRLRPVLVPSRSPVWLAAGAASLVGLAVVLARTTGDRPHAGQQSVAGLASAELRTDSSGRILQVFGPDPRAVLRTYCVSGAQGDRYEPLAVVPSALPGGRTRVGLLRHPAEPETVLSITIHEDTEFHRWVVGDGVQPVVARPAPPGAEKVLARRKKS